MTLPRKRSHSRPAIDLVSFKWARPAPNALRVETRRRASDGELVVPSHLGSEVADYAAVDSSLGASKALSARSPIETWLVQITDVETPYDPLREEPSLFRVFAELSPTDDSSILAFAQTFGPLGVFEMSVVERDQVEQLVPAEPLGVWVREVRAMRHAVDLFDALQNRNNEQLAKWFSLSAEGKTWYRREDALGSHQIGAGLPASLNKRGSSQKALIASAWRVLEDELVNERLTKYVFFRLQRAQLRAVPAHFLGALWLQLARAISGDIRHRRCAWLPCQKWIEITGTFEGRTKAARFCSDAHRVYEYKRRHQKKGSRK